MAMADAPRVSLRPLRARDAGRLLRWRNLPDVARWMYRDHEISEEEHRRWLKAALADPRRQYWIIEANDRPVGLANLYDLSPEDGKTAWAYYIADPAQRGTGIGAFVEFWVIERVFGRLRLGKLWCEVIAENEPVCRLHESFGFQREAFFRQHVRKGGEPLDVVGLGLLASDWARLRPASVKRLESRGFDLTSAFAVDA
jgi:UDP-4-amino-4,6-dideoxy-N-acetyl-beta-L-altrosamine N-acetyltransferase